jgi:hypothetical protein
MLAVQINANLTLNRFIKAEWSVAAPTVVTIKSKLGTLTLASGLTSAHTTAELVAQIHMPFSDVAFGALSRGNIIKDSFKYPLGSRQSSKNKFTITYTDAPQDFQLTKLSERDEDHIDKINREVTHEISGDCVDNYHQAARLVLAERYELRVGDYFNSWASAGAALLLEEGDVVCLTHSAQPGKRNLMLRIEELKVTQNHRVNIIGRLYADDVFPQSPAQRTIPLVTGIGWAGTPPGHVTNFLLEVVAAGLVHGTFTFDPYIGSQMARVEVKRAGETDFSDTGLRVSPDASNHGAFEVSGLPDGVNWFRVVAFSQAGDASATTASIDTTIDGANVLEYQIFDRPEENLEVQVFS